MESSKTTSALYILLASVLFIAWFSIVGGAGEENGNEDGGFLLHGDTSIPDEKLSLEPRTKHWRYELWLFKRTQGKTYPG